MLQVSGARVKTAFATLKSYGPGKTASDVNAVPTEAEKRFLTATTERAVRAMRPTLPTASEFSASFE